jgi:hypothetical protein
VWSDIESSVCSDIGSSLSVCGLILSRVCGLTVEMSSVVESEFRV